MHQDPDNVVSFSLEGNDKARQYFDVNAQSGDVFVKRHLTQDTDETYTVIHNSLMCK